MSRSITVILCITIGIAVVLAAAPARVETEDKGAEIIRIDGGRMNDVHFPHRVHQETLGDCQVCHALFPKAAKSIATLKAQGTLGKKQIMNQHCITCHRQMKSDGLKTGPISCARCHHK